MSLAIDLARTHPRGPPGDGKYFAAMVPATGAKCSIEENDDPQAARVLLVIDLETNTPTVLSGTAGRSRLVQFFWLNVIDCHYAFNSIKM